MRSLWNERDAAQFEGPLAQQVYTSRCHRQDKALVLHGGGNTSVKIRERNVFGDEEDILYVKGSGWDLETIEPAGFAPVRLERALRLATLDRLSDAQMVQELRAAMTNPGAPTPSVETILHASLPFQFVDHTHADALLAITNTPHGVERVHDAYGESVVVIPYVMPGFDLAKLVAQEFPRQAGPNTVGMILLKHGFFSWGETAREAYERMIDLVSRAEDYLAQHRDWDLPTATPNAHTPATREHIAALRKQGSDVAGVPMILAQHTDEHSMAFVQRDDLATISQQGPATPDHVIRTKRLAQLGRDVSAFADSYERYFQEHASNSLQMLDRAPRVILDPRLGGGRAGHQPGRRTARVPGRLPGCGVRRQRADTDRARPESSGQHLRRPGHAGAQRGHLRTNTAHRCARVGRVAQDHVDQPRCQSGAAARGPPAAHVRPARRSSRGDRLQERARARPRRRGVLGFQSRVESARPRRGPGVGSRSHPRQCHPSERRLRYGHLDCRRPGQPRPELRAVGGRVQTQQRAAC